MPRIDFNEENIRSSESHLYTSPGAESSSKATKEINDFLNEILSPSNENTPLNKWQEAITLCFDKKTPPANRPLSAEKAPEVFMHSSENLSEKLNNLKEGESLWIPLIIDKFPLLFRITKEEGGKTFSLTVVDNTLQSSRLQTKNNNLDENHLVEKIIPFTGYYKIPKANITEDLFHLIQGKGFDRKTLYHSTLPQLKGKQIKFNPDLQVKKQSQDILNASNEFTNTNDNSDPLNILPSNLLKTVNSALRLMSIEKGTTRAEGLALYKLYKFESRLNALEKTFDSYSLEKKEESIKKIFRSLTNVNAHYSRVNPLGLPDFDKYLERIEVMKKTLYTPSIGFISNNVKHFPLSFEEGVTIRADQANKKNVQSAPLINPLLKSGIDVIEDLREEEVMPVPESIQEVTQTIDHYLTLISTHKQELESFDVKPAVARSLLALMSRLPAATNAQFWGEPDLAKEDLEKFLQKVNLLLKEITETSKSTNSDSNHWDQVFFLSKMKLIAIAGETASFNGHNVGHTFLNINPTYLDFTQKSYLDKRRKIVFSPEENALIKEFSDYQKFHFANGTRPLTSLFKTFCDDSLVEAVKDFYVEEYRPFLVTDLSNRISEIEKTLAIPLFSPVISSPLSKIAADISETLIKRSKFIKIVDMNGETYLELPPSTNALKNAPLLEDLCKQADTLKRSLVDNYSIKSTVMVDFTDNKILNILNEEASQKLKTQLDTFTEKSEKLKVIIEKINKQLTEEMANCDIYNPTLESFADKVIDFVRDVNKTSLSLKKQQEEYQKEIRHSKTNLEEVKKGIQDQDPIENENISKDFELEVLEENKGESILYKDWAAQWLLSEENEEDALNKYLEKKGFKKQDVMGVIGTELKEIYESQLSIPGEKTVDKLSYYSPNDFCSFSKEESTSAGTKQSLQSNLRLKFNLPFKPNDKKSKLSKFHTSNQWFANNQGVIKGFRPPTEYLRDTFNNPFTDHIYEHQRFNSVLIDYDMKYYNPKNFLTEESNIHAGGNRYYNCSTEQSTDFLSLPFRKEGQLLNIITYLKNYREIIAANAPSEYEFERGNVSLSRSSPSNLELIQLLTLEPSVILTAIENPENAMNIVTVMMEFLSHELGITPHSFPLICHLLELFDKINTNILFLEGLGSTSPEDKTRFEVILNNSLKFLEEKRLNSPDLLDKAYITVLKKNSFLNIQSFSTIEMLRKKDSPHPLFREKVIDNMRLFFKNEYFTGSNNDIFIKGTDNFLHLLFTDLLNWTEEERNSFLNELVTGNPEDRIIWTFKKGKGWSAFSSGPKIPHFTLNFSLIETLIPRTNFYGYYNPTYYKHLRLTLTEANSLPSLSKPQKEIIPEKAEVNFLNLNLTEHLQNPIFFKENSLKIPISEEKTLSFIVDKDGSLYSSEYEGYYVINNSNNSIILSNPAGQIIKFISSATFKEVLEIHKPSINTPLFLQTSPTRSGNFFLLKELLNEFNRAPKENVMTRAFSLIRSLNFSAPLLTTEEVTFLKALTQDIIAQVNSIPEIYKNTLRSVALLLFTGVSEGIDDLKEEKKNHDSSQLTAFFSLYSDYLISLKTTPSDFVLTKNEEILFLVEIANISEEHFVEKIAEEKALKKEIAQWEKANNSRALRRQKGQLLVENSEAKLLRWMAVFAFKFIIPEVPSGIKVTDIPEKDLNPLPMQIATAILNQSEQKPVEDFIMGKVVPGETFQEQLAKVSELFTAVAHFKLLFTRLTLLQNSTEKETVILEGEKSVKSNSQLQNKILECLEELQEYSLFKDKMSLIQKVNPFGRLFLSSLNQVAKPTHIDHQITALRDDKIDLQNINVNPTLFKDLNKLTVREAFFKELTSPATIRKKELEEKFTSLYALVSDKNKEAIKYLEDVKKFNKYSSVLSLTQSLLKNAKKNPLNPEELTILVKDYVTTKGQLRQKCSDLKFDPIFQEARQIRPYFTIHQNPSFTKVSSLERKKEALEKALPLMNPKKQVNTTKKIDDLTRKIEALKRKEFTFHNSINDRSRAFSFFRPIVVFLRILSSLLSLFFPRIKKPRSVFGYLSNNFKDFFESQGYFRNQHYNIWTNGHEVLFQKKLHELNNRKKAFNQARQRLSPFKVLENKRSGLQITFTLRGVVVSKMVSMATFALNEKKTKKLLNATRNLVKEASTEQALLLENKSIPEINLLPFTPPTPSTMSKEDLEVESENLKNNIETLATEGKTREDLSILDRIKFSSGSKTIPDFNGLLLLFEKGNLDEYKNHLKLSEEDIKKLDGMIADYLTKQKELLKISFAEQLRKEGKESEAEAAEKHLLFYSTDNLKNRALLFFEIKEKILLREKQFNFLVNDLWGAKAPPTREKLNNFINEGFTLAKLGTGSGKSKVLALLMQFWASKSHVAVLNIWPESLFKENTKDITKQAKDVYRQGSFDFTFKRDFLKKPRQILAVIKKFNQAIAEGKQINTTPETLQILQLKYNELLNEEANNKHPSTVVLGLQGLLKTIKTMYCLIDEVHINLQPDKSVNFSLGEKQTLTNKEILLITSLYKKLMQNPTWKERLKEGATDKLNPILYQELKEDLATQFAKDFGIENDNLEAFKTYVLDSDDSKSIPNFIKNHSNVEMISLLKGELSVILETTLNSRAGIKFGTSKKDKETLFAIPYSGNDSPVEGAVFDNMHETLNKTIQYYLFKGIAYKANEPNNIFEKYLQEIYKTHSRKIAFEAKWNKPGLDCTKNRAQFKQYYYKNPDFILDFITNFVAPQINKFTQSLESNPQNLLSSLGSTIGMSATPGNETIYGRNVDLKAVVGEEDTLTNVLLNPNNTDPTFKDVSFSRFIGSPQSKIDSEIAKIEEDGKRAKVKEFFDKLFAETTKVGKERIIKDASDDIKETVNDLVKILEQRAESIRIESLISSIDADADHTRMAIDAGGILRGLENVEIASAILKYFQERYKKNPVEGQEIKGVIFYHKDAACILNQKGGIIPFKEGEIDKKFLFTFCDQKRSFGADTKQLETTRGVVTVAKNTTRSELTQGIGRLRQFAKKQQVSFLCEEEITSKQDLITTVTTNQKHKEEEYLYRSLSLQMKNVLKNVVQSILLESKNPQEDFKKFREILVSNASLNCVDMYGNITLSTDPLTALAELHSTLLTKMNKYPFSDQQKRGMKLELDLISNKAKELVKQLPEKIKIQGEGLGKETEISTETEQELAIELEVERVNFHFKAVKNIKYKKFKDLNWNMLATNFFNTEWITQQKKRKNLNIPSLSSFKQHSIAPIFFSSQSKDASVKKNIKNTEFLFTSNRLHKGQTLFGPDHGKASLALIVKELDEKGIEKTKIIIGNLEDDAFWIQQMKKNTNPIDETSYPKIALYNLDNNIFLNTYNVAEETWKKDEAIQEAILKVKLINNHFEIVNPEVNPTQSKVLNEMFENKGAEWNALISKSVKHRENSAKNFDKLKTLNPIFQNLNSKVLREQKKRKKIFKKLKT